MSRRELSFGIIFLPIYVIFVPTISTWLCSVLNARLGASLDDSWACFIAAAISFFVVIFFMHRYLKTEFEVFIKSIGTVIVSLLIGYLIYYVVGLFFSLILSGFLPSDMANPYEMAYYSMLSDNPRPVIAAAVFLFPLAEEVLFRGVVFGNLLEKNRVLAYLISALVFGLSRIWVYAFATSNFSYFVFSLVYIPFGLALAWTYERSRSIWCSYFLNLIICAISLL